MDEVVNIHHAKTHLSRLLADVEAGKTVVIARAGKPIAKLVPVPQGRRQFGAMRGMGSVGPEFFEPLPEEELRAWEGRDEPEPDANSS